METLKYKVIKNKKQYYSYCNTLEHLLESNKKDKAIKEEIELLQLLIEKWDKEHNSLGESDPVELLSFLMTNHQLKAKDMVEILGISKGMVSDILNYNKGMSKGVIRKLSEYFKVGHEAFNKPYELKVGGKKAA